MNDSILWSTFDNISLTDLQTLASKYKGKSVNDLNKVFINRCKPEDRNNPQCKYDVDLLTNVVYNISRIAPKKVQPPPRPPPPKQTSPSKPPPLDYSKLPTKLREKMLQQQKNQPPPVPERSKMNLEYSKQRLGYEPKELNLQKIKPVKSEITSINAQLENLIQRITRDRESALGQKVPELMKTQLQMVKKELNDYIVLLSKSYNDVNKYSPSLIPKYKKLNSEYLILNKYINTYDDFLNSLIKLKNNAPKLASKQDDKSLLKDTVREYVKLVTLNNSLPGQYRIMGYVDKSPLEILYSIKPFVENKDVKQIHKRYKINIPGMSN